MSFNAGAATSQLGLNVDGFKSGILGATALAQTFPPVVTGFLANPLLGVGIAAMSMAKTAVSAIQQMASAVASGIGTGVQLAADFEQAALSFEVMLGSAEKGKAMIADLSKFAEQTPFQMPEVIGLGRQLLAFGQDAEKVLPSVKAIGDVAAGTGRTLGEVGLVYAQVFAKTKLQGEELLQFAEKGVPLRKELEQMTGKTGASFDKMVSSGAVSFSMVEEAFKRMTGEGGKFENMMGRQSQTLGGLLSTLADTANSVLRSLGEGFVEGSGLKGIVGDATSQLESLKELAFDIGKAIGEAIGPPLQRVLDWMAENPEQFKAIIVDVAETVVGALKGIMSIAELLTPILRTILELAASFGSAAAKVALGGSSLGYSSSALTSGIAAMTAASSSSGYSGGGSMRGSRMGAGSVPQPGEPGSMVVPTITVHVETDQDADAIAKAIGGKTTAEVRRYLAERQQSNDFRQSVSSGL